MSETKNFAQTGAAEEEAENTADGACGAERDAQPETAAKEAGASEPAPAPAPEDVIAKLAKENGELKEGLLRQAAEMENLRKRTAREIADAKSFAVSAFARDMLSVADNLSRALSAIAPEEREADPQLKSLADGVEMTERAMLSALTRHGVRKIETVGQKFNPNFHDAIGAMEDKTVPHNTIKHEAEAGYTINGRVLRPAKVMTAQGGAKDEK